MTTLFPRIILAALALALFPLLLPAADLERQRRVFREVWPDAELGIRDSIEQHRALLENYILWPDLRAAFLRATLQHGNDDDVRAFLERHGDLKPARELRYRYALSLAKRGRDAAYRDLYETHYRELGIARLDCLYLRTRLDAEPDWLLASVRRHWLVGHSQVDECDPVFDKLKDTGHLDTALFEARYELAVAARELSMARYLARSLDASREQEAARWSRAYGNSRRFLDGRAHDADSAVHRRQLLAAIEQIAYDDPEGASRYWQDLRDEHDFTAAELAATDRHVTLWQARHHLPDALDALNRLDGEAVDTEVLRWRVRSALRAGRLDEVAAYVHDLPATERNKPQWRYWLAVALREDGDADTAGQLFTELAGERSYYGFLAADALGRDYRLSHQRLPADDALLEKLAAREDLRRARELHAVGLDGRGRSEWDRAVLKLAPDAQLQAAILADRWGWHSRAIATAAQHERYDDLVMRYPLPFLDLFSRHAEAASIRPSWALGVARSESLFMRDIRSPAGAIGLMQLTTGTGRRTARKIGEPWTGYKTLTDPQSNIRLGTWFLGEMQARFADNPVLATAAYNAGPLRVEAWLPGGQPLDARIWIDTIPYAETRAYVRRVLTAEAIFHWRLHGDVARLSSRLAPVPRAAAITGPQESRQARLSP